MATFFVDTCQVLTQTDLVAAFREGGRGTGMLLDAAKATGLRPVPLSPAAAVEAM